MTRTEHLAMTFLSPWAPGVLVALLLPLAAAAPAGGQESGAESADARPVVIGQRYTLTSEILGEDRPVLIGLPDGYEDSGEPYPVIYVLDGGAHFHHTTGTARFLAENNRMPAAIVVGIPNLSGEGRTRDLTPPAEGDDALERFPTAGGAEAFLRFLTDELRPWVDARYRTRSYDLLIGHSFGGLFVTEALSRDPGAFDGYLSISPSLWWNEEGYVADLADLFDRHPDATGSLYMTMGNEGGDMLSGAWTFAGTLEKHAPRGFRWSWRHMPDETHGSVPHRSTYDGLEWTFDGWDGTAGILAVFQEKMTAQEAVPEIEAHYQALSARMGYPIPPPVDLVLQAADFLREENRADEAMTFNEAAVRWAAERSDVHLGYAEALRVACRLDEAEAHLEQALDIARRDDDDGEVERAAEALEAIRTANGADAPCTPGA